MTIGKTSEVIHLASLGAPPPRAAGARWLVTIPGGHWRAFALHGEALSVAMLDDVLPDPPHDRCLPRVGDELHATTVLDGGARLLIDEQELPVGATLRTAGYRHTTSAELPVRQLRPPVAAEAAVCLVWGGAVGAHRRDGGAVEQGVRAFDDGAGGLVLTGAQVAHVAADGARTAIPSLGSAVPSPDAHYVASIDTAQGAVEIAEVATATVVRRWTAPLELGLSPTITWAASDVVMIETDQGAKLVPIDPALPVRAAEDDVQRAPASPFGAKLAGQDVAIVRVRDGVEVARHRGVADEAAILPDSSGRVVVKHGDDVAVIALDGQRTAIACRPTFTLEPRLLDGDRLELDSSVCDLESGRALDGFGPGEWVTATERWSIVGGREPRLTRTPIGGGTAREVRLSTAGLPFQAALAPIPSKDQRRITASYAIDEELSAVAIWDADTGALLWVGPPDAQVVGDWVIAGGRAFVPSLDVDAVLADTGARTNLRVCRGDLRAVPVLPPPQADTYWAPEAACGAPR